jgi:hypothetical protein
MITIRVTDFLLPMVKEGKDPLIAQIKSQVKDRFSDSKGSLKKIEVFDGAIFIDVDSEATVTAVREMFGTVPEAKVTPLEPLQAIFMKSQLRAKADAQKAADAKAKAASIKS